MIIRTTLLGSIATLGIAAASVRAQDADSIAAGPGTVAAARALSGLIERERAEKGIPALSIALVDGRRVVWARGFGWADSGRASPAGASTVYRVGSVSKLFTDIGIMQRVEKGALSLDAPITRYLPDFRPRNPFGGVITIRELTAHRAGLTREPPVGNYFDASAPSLAATVASLNRTSLVYAPGTHTKYSNAGIAVLGYVLERTRGESFYPYLRRSVLDPLGMTASAFEPLPALRARLAKGWMWTLDGRRFEAPTFQLGMGPCGSMYTTVVDLGRFLGVLMAGGAADDGRRVVARATIDSMWTPQFAPAGQKEGYGIGFALGHLDGHRSVGHGGAIYGFATTLIGLPDDSLGVVVVATLDGANAVTDRIGETALRLMLGARARAVVAVPPPSAPLPRQQALGLMGRYRGRTGGIDLEEFEGQLYATPLTGGSRSAVRLVSADGSSGQGSSRELITDDVLAYGERMKATPEHRLVVGRDTFVRAATPGSEIVGMAAPKPPTASAALTEFIGEYGWNHDVLYVREKGGQLNALIEWFFEYPLERVSGDVFRFPHSGLYDGQEIVFKRGADGRVDGATVATVPFPRRALPADNDAVNFRITPVRPVSELRRDALASRPPVEQGTFRRPDLVELRSLDSSIRYDVRYATSNNFMGTPFYSSAHAFMQRPAAQAVARAAAELRRLGYGLLVHDAYRPWYVTRMFWDGTPPDKHVFVADPSQGSRHNRGAAVDITLYDLSTGRPIRMTGGYDEMSDRSYPLYPGGTSLQRWHRDLLRHAMEAQGFAVYEAEWWHFDFGDWRSYPIGNLTFEQLDAAR